MKYSKVCLKEEERPDAKTPEAKLRAFAQVLMTIYYGRYNLSCHDFDQRVEEVMGRVKESLKAASLTQDDLEEFNPQRAARHVIEDPRVDLRLGLCEVNKMTSDKLIEVVYEATERVIWGTLCRKSLNQSKPG